MQTQILKALIAGGMLVMMNLCAHAQSWSLNGNAGTTSTNFLGTTDGQDFRIKTNGNPRITVKSNGKVGIGITSPVTKLQVSSSVAAPVSLSADGLFVIGDKSAFNIGFDPQDIQARNNGNGATLYQNFYGGDVQLGPGINPVIYKATNGNLGVGVINPQQKLDVNGNINIVLGSALYVDSKKVFFIDSVKSNIFIGNQAGASNSTGSGNTANGVSAFKSNTSGYFNSSYGYKSLQANTSGYENTANGTYALFASTTSSDNTATGYAALESNTTGYSNTSIGSMSLFTNSTGNNNCAAGFQSLYSNSTGNWNTAFGSSSLTANTIGIRNTAVGFESLRYNTQGYDNSALGLGSLYSNITGYSNTAVGYEALYTNSSGYNNVAVGQQALELNTTASDNTAVGIAALNSNTTGNFNTAVGSGALAATSTSDANTAVGYAALQITTGAGNTGIGGSTLFSNTGGVANSAFGTSALTFNTSGNYNTASGFNAMMTNSTGNNNTVIGAYSDVLYSNLSNSTAVGYQAVVTTSNAMRFGNGTVSFWGFGANYAATKALIVGSSASNGNGAYLTIGGAWTNTSDRDLKEDIQQLDKTDILKKINELNIAKWKYKGTANEYHIGPMAQDFYSSFNVGTDNKSISTIDPAGVALIGIQALYNDQQKTKAAISSTNFTQKEMQDQLSQKDKMLMQFQISLDEKQKQIDEMKVRLNDFENALAQCCSSFKSNNSAEQNAATLEQNTPNPFTENTVIRFYIPSSAKNAIIKIVAIDGKEIRTVSINQHGIGQATIEGNSLAAGTYSYQLIIDGKAIDNKLMTLTK